jgi:hypothetical protein
MTEGESNTNDDDCYCCCCCFSCRLKRSDRCSTSHPQPRERPSTHSAHVRRAVSDGDSEAERRRRHQRLLYCTPRGWICRFTANDVVSLIRCRPCQYAIGRVTAGPWLARLMQRTPQSRQMTAAFHCHTVNRTVSHAIFRRRRRFRHALPIFHNAAD